VTLSAISASARHAERRNAAGAARLEMIDIVDESDTPFLQGVSAISATRFPVSS
jgi:hypothetical protein